MTNLTELETKGLEGIVNSDFHDGSDPVENPVWTWSANPFPDARTFSGVMSSLVKKGYAKADNWGPVRDRCVSITKEGMEALKASKVGAAS